MLTCCGKAGFTGGRSWTLGSDFPLSARASAALSLFCFKYNSLRVAACLATNTSKSGEIQRLLNWWVPYKTRSFAGALLHGRHVPARAKGVEHDANDCQGGLDIHFLIRHETWHLDFSSQINKCVECRIILPLMWCWYLITGLGSTSVEIAARAASTFYDKLYTVYWKLQRDTSSS
jgi:hypothetical protein